MLAGIATNADWGIWLSMEEKPGMDSESVWIRQIAEGDRTAFEKLYQAYQARIFRYLFRMVGNAETAEELTNDAMVAAWKAASGFKGQSKASTWLFGIAHHKALNELRRTAPQTVEIENAAEISAPGEGPEAAARRHDVERGVQGALRELSPEHREVVELTFYQGLSYQEIAEIMECPVNTVKTRMYYAKQRLQAALESKGISGETL